MIMKYQLRWAGHLFCLEDTYMPKQVLYGELTYSKCSQCKLHKYFKDNLKVILKNINVETNI